MQISVVATPYGGAGRDKGGGPGPRRLLDKGLTSALAGLGHEVREVRTVELSPSEEVAYGDWERVGLANGRLAAAVGAAERSGHFVLGLLADCNALIGMLGGLQRSDDPLWPLRVGLISIDAHADYNTPETSPSGLLGGMPIAVAAGKALHRLRLSSGLAVPLQSPDIVLAGPREVDRLEGRAIAEDGVHSIRPTELARPDGVLKEMLCRLAGREDVIYVHVDLDILDPSVAPAAGLPSPGGLTGSQLGAVLHLAVRHPKVRALGLASYRAGDDSDEGTLAEVMEALLAAAGGLAERDRNPVRCP